MGVGLTFMDRFCLYFLSFYTANFAISIGSSAGIYAIQNNLHFIGKNNQYLDFAQAADSTVNQDENLPNDGSLPEPSDIETEFSVSPTTTDNNDLGKSVEPREDYSKWNHNGSIMRLEVDGTSRRMFYVLPRSAMIEAGWQDGDLLFSGEAQGETYSGIARLNSKICGVASYRVHGFISDGGSRITMKGQAPRRDRTTCQVIGYQTDVMEFILIEEP